LKPIETKINIIVDELHTIISIILIYHIILGLIGVVGVVVAGVVVAGAFALTLYSKHP